MNILIKNKIFILAFLSVLAFLLVALPKTIENPVREYQKYYIEKTNNELVTLYLEESITRDQMNLGLMYRDNLPPLHGMIFIFDYPDKASFWMKNTYISLDLIMLDSDGKVREIYPNQTPQSLRPINSKSKVKYVIELQAGETKNLGINVGDILDITPKTNH
jgi:uncharacterized membrane protein (UPF0127 family)